MRCTTQSIVKPAARTPRLMPATVRPAIDASSVRLHTKIASKNAERVHLAQCPSPALNGRVTADINSLTICEIAGLSESFTDAVRPLREGNSRSILKFHRERTPKRVRPKPLRPAGVFMRAASTLPPKQRLSGHHNAITRPIRSPRRIARSPSLERPPGAIRPDPPWVKLWVPLSSNTSSCSQ
jgi:hypothetical protein